MKSEQMAQLDRDLRSSTQVEVYGPKQQHGGFKGMWMAPRYKGWRVWVDMLAGLVKAGHENANKEDRVRPIDEVGEIAIYVDGEDSPRIFWRRDETGNLVRETY